MNIEKTELETTPSETGVKERVRTKDRQGPDRPSEPPPPAPPSEPPAGPDDPKPPRRGGGFLAFLSLLFSLAALALAAWMWWQAQAGESAVEAEAMAEIARLEANDSELSLKIKQVRDEVDSLASDGNVTAEFEAMQRRIRADGEKMAEVEQVMREQMALSRSLQTAAESLQGRLLAAEATVTNLSTRELDAGGELDLAEVDYLLRLANERLKLFSDPEAADQALEVADMHLAALDSPMYLGVRQEIALARQSLDALEMPDYLEISRRMDKLQAAI
ncbi:MAG: uroporphyrinogen-III C-methyltransferase, partial [Gammaproteobacteria bacterium]|nr:uroporphyrinogen-III C-methyltransferase [Gammaproteobacteria bacterium]